MSLEQKAKKLAARQNLQPVDWDDARELWLSSLSDLHVQIVAWLKPLQDKKLVKLRKVPMRISEPLAGVYRADALVLEFGDVGIVLEPVGANVPNGRGRVDVYRRGYRSSADMVLLTGSGDSLTWEIWHGPSPRHRKPLTQRSFEELVESLLGD